MTTQTLVTCNGKINQHGFCDKCYQPSHTTSNQCSRLVPYQQAEINTLLAVSGQLLSVRAAAVKYADNKWKNRDEWLTEYNQSIADFEAGAQWLISQAASASGAVDKTVSEGKYDTWKKGDELYGGKHQQQVLLVVTGITANGTNVYEGFAI